MASPGVGTLQEPQDFLTYLHGAGEVVDLTSFSLLEMWALGAVAALGRQGRRQPVSVRWDDKSQVRAFAQAVGFDDALSAGRGEIRGEPGRTVRLSPVEDEDDIGPAAAEVARLLAGDDAGHGSAREVLRYVLIELLRNVIQHSADKLGGLVGAQLNNRGRHASKPVFQAVVVDTGRGIRSSLKRHHPQINDDREALEVALRPYISGAFPAGRTGNEQNAGLGLFFISEMAKETEGRLLVASQSAALVIDSGLQGHAQLLPVGYPGTLVAFEVPVTMPVDFLTVFNRISERSRERKPNRLRSDWLRFEEPPARTKTYAISAMQENTSKAKETAHEAIIPKLLKKQPVALDFHGVTVVTQSFAHVLLYEALRIAWASQTPIYVINAEPFVKSAILHVQIYAQGG